MCSLTIAAEGLLARFEARAAAIGKHPFLDPRSRFVYGAAALLIAGESLVLGFAGFTLADGGYRRAFLWTLGMLASALLARRYGHGGIALGLEAICLPAIVGGTIAAATFMVSAIAAPLADNILDAADRTLGFDWLALLHLYHRVPALVTVSHYFYASLYTQLWLVPLCLAIRGRADRLWVFLTAWTIAGIATALIHPLFPAAGPYWRYGVMQQVMPGYAPSPLGNYLWDVGAKIDAIRGGTLRELTAAMRGLVSFPSFHAAAAVLFAWSALPLRYIRLPLVLLNAGMWLSCLISGSHYLIDLIAGTAVAAAALALAIRIVAAERGLPSPGAADQNFTPSSTP